MNKHKEVNRVATLGIFANLLLLIGKLVVGFAANSQAMIADGLNSAGDVFASVMTYIGNKISSKPSDEDHPFGHGKAEYIFSMIISFSLLLVAFTIFTNSFNAIIKKESIIFSKWLIIVAVATIIIKALLYIHASYIGRKYNSLLAHANAVDHRNDVFITLLTLFGIITSYYNIHLLDGIVGILIAFWIAYSAISIFTTSYTVLMDTNISKALLASMEEKINTIESVDHIDTIHALPTGLQFILMVKVSIDAHITVYEGHEISDRVKEILLDFDDVLDVIVHVNPAQYHQ